MRSRVKYRDLCPVLSLSFPICKIKTMACQISRVSLTSEILWLNEDYYRMSLESSPLHS